MYCIKEEKRSIFSLFKIYSCQKCNYHQIDESFVIGTTVINIYCINQCYKSQINNDFVISSYKLKLLLRDFCIYRNDYILLWIDYIEPLEKYELCFELLFKMNMNIHIIKL